MARTNSGNYDALALVQDEAQQSLDDVLKALTLFIDSPEENASLELCITYLHQINSLLEMLNLQGANILATEMLASAIAIRDSKSNKSIDIQDSLLKGLLILPNYLKLISDSLQDHPLRLISTINELRIARGDEPVSEQSLFKPTLSVALPEIVAPSPNQEIPNIGIPSDKISPAFQISLLHWIKKDNIQGLRKMAQIIRYIRLSSTHERSIILWWAAESIIESVLEQSLPQSALIKLNLGKLTQPIQSFFRKGEQEFLTLFPTDLLHQLLLIAATSSSSSEYISALKKTFNLGFFDAQQSLKIYGFSNNARSDANIALLEQLQGIKEQIEQLDRNDSHSLEAVQKVAEQLAIIASTLQILSENDAYKILSIQVESLESTIRQEQFPNDNQIISIANALLQLEDILQQGMSNNQLSQDNDNDLQRSVINECLNELTSLKDTLDLLVDQPQNSTILLSEAANKLALISGSISMLNLPDAASLIESTSQQLSTQSALSENISSQSLTKFSEIIAAIELYLSNMSQFGQQQPLLLENAQEVLQTFKSTQHTNNSVVNSQTPIPASSISGVESYIRRNLKAETSVERYIKQLPSLTCNTSQMAQAITSVERYIRRNSNTTTGVSLYIERQAKESTTLPKKVPTVIIDELDTSPIVESTATNYAEGIDEEIAEIFIEEAEEVLAELSSITPSWINGYDLNLTKNIRRYFHTLKGSGRMAGATILGELAWSIEEVFNCIIEGEASCSSDVVDLVVNSQQLIPDLLIRFTHGDMNSTEEVSALTKIANNILNSSDIETNVIETNFSEEDELEQIFISEAKQHLNVLENALEDATSPFVLTKELLRAAHSIKGCANIAQVTPAALVATQLDKTFKYLFEHNQALNEEQLPLLIETIYGLRQIIAHLQSSDVTEPDIDTLIANLEHIKPAKETMENTQEKRLDPEFLIIFIEETDDLLNLSSQQLESLKQQPNNANLREDVKQTFTTLIDSAKHAEQSALVKLYQLFSTLIEYKQDDTQFNLLEFGHDEVNLQIESLLQNKPSPSISDYQKQVEDFVQNTPLPKALSNPGLDNADADLIDLTIPTNESPTPEVTAESFTLPDGDLELLEAFTEEFGELLESSDSAIKQWQADKYSSSAIMQLQRDLHTIKGGARLAEITPVADLTHHFESFLSTTLNNEHELSESFFNLLQRCQDRLADMQDLLTRNDNLYFAHDLLLEIKTFYSTRAQEEITPILTNIKEKEVIPESSPQKKTKLTDAAKHPAEQIRVRSDLLDFLTNFAGEVNISHDRVSQQNIAVKKQLLEMESTVVRLQAQLRNLEMETEAQILFRYENTIVEEKTDFDPLELDRFSMIHQLSRSLTESVSDLNDITNSLNTIVNESDAILLQQSRLGSDLQNGLMNTRLLPFAGLTPRFERIIRQTSVDLKKKVALTVIGAEREIDRNILDRIVSPLEHLMRNAIAHGIEPPEMRRVLGKDETGLLHLTITREGSEILIVLSDDGQGINIEKVKQKALDNGLINLDNMPTDEEITQLILTSGLSTADNISQVSGRGVGMDVVSNDIRALKGQLSIHSVTGQGSTFTIRLPITLSVMQALLVKSHDQQYAVPLAAIHAGERISIQEINTILQQDDEPRYKFNNQFYRLIPLAILLDQPFKLPEDPNLKLPLLLFKFGDQYIAILVDSINSNREIVLKSVGEQLDHISSITGATILGDGQVAFALDIPALIKNTDLSNSLKEQDYSSLSRSNTLQQSTLAMVVDDSITMRKASSNVLKRHGFNVITARDGLDAIAQLSENTPDIILLDVEMPRMDGFEFATVIRNDPKFKDLPIIMITSRTGDKHRNRAIEIGVNDYLGKPYQEVELVASMKTLLGDKYPVVHD